MTKALFNKVTKNLQTRTPVSVTRVSSTATAGEISRELTKFLTATSSGSSRILYLIDFSIELRRSIISSGAAAFDGIFNTTDVAEEYLELLSSAVVNRLIPVTTSLSTFDNTIIHLVLDGDTPPSKYQTGVKRAIKCKQSLYSCVNKLLSREYIIIIALKIIYLSMAKQRRGGSSQGMSNYPLPRSRKLQI